MYNHLLRPCVLTGRCSLLPVVNNSGAICNSWKLDPSTLRFPLRGMLPFDKVTNALDLYTTHTFRRTEVWLWFVCYHIGPFWATDRVATLCTRTALFKRDGVQHVGAQQAGKTTSSSFVFFPLPPYQDLQMPPHFLPPLFSSYHLTIFYLLLLLLFPLSSMIFSLRCNSARVLHFSLPPSLYPSPVTPLLPCFPCSPYNTPI